MQILPPFFSRIGKLIIFLLIEATCFYLVSNNGVIQRYVLPSKIRDIQKSAWEKRSNVISFFNLYTVNDSLAKLNARLITKNALLSSKVARLEHMLSGGDSALFALDSCNEFRFKAVRVIRNSVNSTHNYIVIDKGRKDGIGENMGVITTNGVIGSVRAVSDNCALVLSFLNSNQTYSARIGNKGAFGPLRWGGGAVDEAFLSEMPQHIEINQGDTVYTSGFSSLYPGGIPVGRVESWEINDGAHKIAKVKLFLDFSRLNFAYVVSNKFSKEIDTLIESSKHITEPEV